MKKLLYTTSALVGAAFLMEAVVPAKAEVNMSLRYRAALLSRSLDKDSKDTEIKPEGTHSTSTEVMSGVGTKSRNTSLNSAKINIDISGEKDHPNGLTTGASVAIATGKNKLDYDNAFGYISGSFGKVDVGDFHDIGYRALGYGTPGTANFGAVDPGFNPAGASINTSATGNIGARASGVTYWSPSFSGAQVGVSWHPQVTTGGLGDDQTGVEGKKASFTSTQGDIEDSIGVAATYSGSFGGTGVSMGISYETAKVVSRKPDALGWGDRATTAGEPTEANGYDPDDSTTHTGILDVNGDLKSGKFFIRNLGNGSIGTVSNTEQGKVSISKKNQDPVAFAGYISFDIQNFTVGGSYGSWEQAAANSVTTAESTAYALGASYSIDALTFGLGWAKQDAETTFHNIRLNSKASVTTAADINATAPVKVDVKTSILAFTTKYQVGDGAAIDFVVEKASIEGLEAATGTKLEDDATGFGVGIDLKF